MNYFDKKIDLHYGFFLITSFINVVDSTIEKYQLYKVDIMAEKATP